MSEDKLASNERVAPYDLEFVTKSLEAFKDSQLSIAQRITLRALQELRERRAADEPPDAIDFRALAGRLRKVGGAIRKTYEWQAGELEVIAEDLDGLSPTKQGTDL